MSRDGQLPLLLALVLCALILVLHSNAAMVELATADMPDTSDVRAQIEKALLEAHEKQRNVGLAAAVLLRGELLYSGALGFADLEHQVRVSPETRFAIASVTKAFTGIALLKLCEAGRMNLDVPIQRYVPSFPQKRGGQITPRLLAAHLAGIRHWGDERTPALYSMHYDDVAKVLPLFQNDPLIAEPGAKYSYSSPGYNLLAAAIQSASSTTFQRYVEQTILQPLGLKNTRFDDVRRVIAHRARRYSFYDPATYAESTELFRVPEWDYSHNMGGGNMLSTAEDLVRFGGALTKPGFLTQPSLRLLYTRPKTDRTESSMSFGWFVSPAGAPRRESHTSGSNPGVQAVLYVYPDEDLEVAILSNTWGLGSRSAEMVTALPQRIAAICLERALPR